MHRKLPNRDTQVSLTHLLREIKADHDKRWEKRWTDTPRDLKGHHYVGDWKKKPDRLFGEDRIICSTVTQLRMGHGHFGTYLCRMGFRTLDRCICFNGSRESPQHLGFHCPRYSASRAEASRRCRIPFHTRAFLYTDIAHKELTSLIRDTRIGTRHERQEKEAKLAGAALLEDNMRRRRKTKEKRTRKL
jgi:hypothetical protein